MRLSCLDLILASIILRNELFRRGWITGTSVQPGDDDLKICLNPGRLKTESKASYADAFL
jgi:hypothetical protein